MLNTLFRTIALVSLIGAMLFTTNPTKAEGIEPNPAAEAYLLNELRTSGIVDLQWNFSETERGVSGATVLAALQDPTVQSKPLIYIASAVITDDLWARDLIIPANVVFASVEFNGLVNFASTELQSFDAYDSTFRGEVYFSDSSINRQIYIAGNIFDQTVYFDGASIEETAIISGNELNGNLSIQRASFNGNVDLRNNLINGSFGLYGTAIAGEFLLDGSQIWGTEPIPGTTFPVEVWNVNIAGLASFTDVTFNGEAYFVGSSFNRLNVSGSTFNQYANFREVNVNQIADFLGTQFLGDSDFTNFSTGRDLNANGAVFTGAASFSNGNAERDINFMNATFNSDVYFDYITVGRFADFTGATFAKTTSFYFTTIAYPYFDTVTFNGHVNFEGLQAEQAFEIVNSVYTYAEAPLTLESSDVSGVVSLSNINAPAGLQLSASHFGDLTITTKDDPTIKFIDLTATTIDGELLLENVTMEELLAEGASIGESTTLKHISVTQTLDLSNAAIGFLKVDDQFTWPQNTDSFILRGMTYLDIDLGDKGLTEETWQRLLRLVNESVYSPQSYEALSNFLTDKGHPDWAADVEFAQKERERNEILTPFSGAWFWSWFLAVFSGYGYRPAFAFVWSGLVVTIGAFVFRRKEDMLPVEQEDAQLEYNPVWYSFALFLPYIDLGIASKWEPNPSRLWARNYKYVHMILGWVLAPIALLTFGGILS